MSERAHTNKCNSPSSFIPRPPHSSRFFISDLTPAHRSVCSICMYYTKTVLLPITPMRHVKMQCPHSRCVSRFLLSNISRSSVAVFTRFLYTTLLSMLDARACVCALYTLYALSSTTYVAFQVWCTHTNTKHRQTIKPEPEYPSEMEWTTHHGHVHFICIVQRHIQTHTSERAREAYARHSLGPLLHTRISCCVLLICCCCCCCVVYGSAATLKPVCHLV